MVSSRADWFRPLFLVSVESASSDTSDLMLSESMSATLCMSMQPSNPETMQSPQTHSSKDGFRCLPALRNCTHDITTVHSPKKSSFPWKASIEFLVPSSINGVSEN